MTGLQGPAGYCQGTIDRIDASVGANGIALARLREGSNDRTTLERITVAPHNRAGGGPDDLGCEVKTMCFWPFFLSGINRCSS